MQGRPRVASGTRPCRRIIAHFGKQASRFHTPYRMSGEGGGRVKEDRRQPLGNLLPLHSTAALRRLRMNYSKRNRVTGFPLLSVFSHALGRKRRLRSGGE